MGVTCPSCGQQSRDEEFCDHCNSDLAPPPDQAPLHRCPIPDADPVLLTTKQVAALARPDAALRVSGPAGDWRVHWIPRNLWERRRPLLEERLKYTLAVLPPLHVIEEEKGLWVLAAAGQQVQWWRERHPRDPVEDLGRLQQALDSLARALEELHRRELVWLTFDPRQIEEVDSGQLRFTNLDLEIHALGNMPDRLKVQAAFAAPEVRRFREEDLGPATAVFHLALFAYYWLAGLLPEGFAGQGPGEFGYLFPPLRIYNPGLSPGLSGLLVRCLAVEPSHRILTPAEFCKAFKGLRGWIETRGKSHGPLRWEIGQHTRTGRAKGIAGKQNEDQVLVRTFPNPERALLAVADGISTCDVGSGALASWMTCLLLDNSFDELATGVEFPEKVSGICRRAAASLLEWAVDKGHQEQLAAGRDLMGTTLLAGWLEENALTVANVGDSRAYLFTPEGTIDQLTVDGDLGNELLAAGVPPEDVRSLGGMARGLRDCVGGCTLDPKGKLVILESHCRPTMSRLDLLPGDIVVLCSDGLAEEGAFLEPEAMAELIHGHAHLSAQDLTVKLADAADALQRLPSHLEPDGFGDNITCIVVKIMNAEK